MSKVISSGVIIIDKRSRKLLACHCSCHSYRDGNWDIGKGHVERNETHEHAAIRELKEETGIIISNSDLFDCGLFLYTKYKDLHLYIAEYDVDITKLHCSTYFNYDGRCLLETDDYKLIDDTDVKVYFKSLQPIITQCLKKYKAEKGLL